MLNRQDLSILLKLHLDLRLKDILIKVQFKQRLNNKEEQSSLIQGSCKKMVYLMRRLVELKKLHLMVLQKVLMASGLLFTEMNNGYEI